MADGSAKFARQHPHERCRSLEALRAELARVEALGGEGLMLRQPGSKYAVGRSATLLKVKTFQDAEAAVIGHQAGEGRHKGRLGALLVRLPNGTEFAIGTGFSDRERSSPPLIGATVTFRYQELSDGGVPRFPSYVGIREDGGKTAEVGGQRAEDRSQRPEVGGAMAAGSKGRYFEYTEGSSNKFWEVSQAGNMMTTRWGRIGSAGQSKTKTFADAQAAANAVAMLVEEKTDEGYRERTV